MTTRQKQIREEIEAHKHLIMEAMRELRSLDDDVDALRRKQATLRSKIGTHTAKWNDLADELLGLEYNALKQAGL